jgi:ankyrin repeat protein
LRWVAMASRPLTLQELAVAVDIQPVAPISVEQAIHDQVTLCEPLLKIYETEVSLVHQSARDYLLEVKPSENQDLEIFRIIPQRAHLELAQKCLDTIHETFNSVHQKFDSQQSPLFTYSVKYWPEHARDCLLHAEELFDPSLPFFQKKSTQRSEWSNLYEWETISTPSPNLLHLASYFGIDAWVLILLTKKTLKSWFRNPANKRDKNGRTALLHAAHQGHKTVVKLLVETGKADITVKDVNGLTALSLAVIYGHEAVVKLFVETRKADIEAKDENGLTALLLAAVQGYKDIVEMLIEKGKADIEAKNENGLTALLYTAAQGNEAIVKLLVETGKSNVEMKDKGGMTALLLQHLEDTRL